VHREFHRDITLKSLARMVKPARRTKEEALASGDRVMRGVSLKKDEAFANVSVFSEVLEYHDVTKHSKVDLAHTIGNALKLFLDEVTNTGGGKARFAAKYKKQEMEQLMRFEYLNEKVAGKLQRYHNAN
jgi:hypothetical protein